MHTNEDAIGIKEEIESFQKVFRDLCDEIGKEIVGNKDIIEAVLTAFFAGGHVLLEGVPGLGKTSLVKSLSKALGFDFSRIQFTPDLMPADIVGTQIVVERSGGIKEFEFSAGPIFSNIILADEINRATPKTQSAMLEAMEEGQVTVSGKTHKLVNPFFVLATQNPIEMEGTYTLPEAQLDRFFVKVNLAFPNNNELKEILRQTTVNEKYAIQPVFDPKHAAKKVAEMKKLVRNVLVSSKVEDYVVNIISMTHPDNLKVSSQTVERDDTIDLIKRYVTFGSSPRGAQSVVLAAKVMALLDNRANISYDDVDKVAVASLNHRLLLNFEADADNIKSKDIIENILERAKESR
ncbi:MAG: AAA family ATPase [Candidatus Scalindua sp. AMX11]|nr:MAG: AAA family ATPase [Candidatus Scalindua sp.]NOG86021.1 AAA family ATPase [Planctomycetota bacterium]RZV91354.1 MAG: AAA family ATPase [Candidatus Scalindua sp. SCAELEC01]TDE66014.1 MAG: AAA family ATPase [Candidatus Scalindua sp. AMX11]GJQ60735.1 MAG: ATPase [Candidatus Scalindua sp.]